MFGLVAVIIILGFQSSYLFRKTGIPDVLILMFFGFMVGPVLQVVKASIERTYSTTSIRGDGQVILVPFTDGITFEVVPAFINKDDSYTYPDANNGGRWRVTNPRPEINAIRTRNNTCPGKKKGIGGFQ